MTEDEKKQQQCKPQIIHLWMQVDEKNGLAKTLNWLLFPTTSLRHGVVFALNAKEVECAIKRAQELVPGLNWEGEETDEAIITSANCTGKKPYVPLTFDRYPTRLICVEYPTKPTAKEVLALYKGRISKELRSYRGDFLGGGVNA